jgi:predicted nucleic acid-binding protein
LDAIHLAVALQLGVDALISYDKRMAEAAGEIGLAVAAPQ